MPEILKTKVERNENHDKKNIDISFIFLTYNEEKYLPKVLAAIQELISSLTYEIIVVDNGSTDATVNIAHEFGAMILCTSPEPEIADTDSF